MKIIRKFFVPAWSIALIFSIFLGPSSAYIQGDIDGDGEVGLSDAISVMQFLSKMNLPTTFQKEAHVGGDQRIGIDEALYVLQVVSGLRSQNSSPTASFTSNPKSGDTPLC